MSEQSWSDELRAAIRECGMTIFQVSIKSGVSQPVIHRFLAGQRGLNLVTAEKIGRAVGVRLTRDASE